MELKDQLIHDICVYQERLNFLYAHHPSAIDDIEKLKKRQKNAVDMYLVEITNAIRHKIMRDYRERARNTAKVKTFELLHEMCRQHMGTGPTPCVYDFQFDKLVEKIDEIYHPAVCLDNKITLMDIDEQGRGFNPRRLDPLKGDEIVDQWNKEAGSKSVEP